MSENTAISVNRVSKKFRLFNSSKERLLEALHPLKKKYHREFWALRDVSFEVEKGKTIGIVGRNGSGKSTLLEIICSVLKPTSGEVNVRGKVFALLELGAGFNPQLTGRENVFLKGTIMGFTREEMKDRVPYIEEFADIGEFIDQPVRVYSSGMFVRLAFATAINVDPDILVVDEALSVGDAKFQHKCFNKFIEFQEAGKTILFVSHSTEAVLRHCDRAILLDGGRLLEAGEPKTIVNRYIDTLFSSKEAVAASTEPLLIEGGYRGFNIIHYGKKYFGFAQSLGDLDVSGLDDEALRELKQRRECVEASTPEEARLQVDRICSPEAQDLTGSFASSATEMFVREAPLFDNCVNRRSYNKNEYRHGDKRGEIVDYLITAGDKTDPVNLRSGETIDICMKTRFHEAVKEPMYGFAITTADGFIVYGTNTRLCKITVPSVEANSSIVVKWSVRAALNSGDFFINLGVAEKMPGMDQLIDNRKDVIHLRVHSSEDFDGFARFETSFEEISDSAKKSPGI